MTLAPSRTPAVAAAPAADPRVAIVVASRNRRELVLHTLGTHLRLPERPRVVLVDDASTDGTVAAVRREQPEVEAIALPRPLGAAARNVGVRAVEQPYVAFCDDDSWWTPGALRRAADLFERHPRLALINGRVLVGPGRRLDDVCATMARSALPPVGGQPGQALLSFIACGAVVRRTAWLEVGGFPRRFGVGGEEEIVGWDLAAAGWQMSYVAQLVARHDPPANDGRPERRERDLRNALWSTWLRRPLPTAARRTLAELRSRPLDRSTARAVAAAVGGLPWIVRERKVSPPHVEAMQRRLREPAAQSRP